MDKVSSRDTAFKIRVSVKRKMKLKEWFGQVPYGYSRQNTKLIENLDEQKVIRIIEDLRTKYKSYTEIADYLNDKGVNTRYTRKGKRSIWYPTTVRNIVNRRIDVISEYISY